MPVRYENPREVGADRIVNAVAAFEMFGGPVIAVDFGTATTFDCVSREGEYLGGAIFPGIHIAMEALFERASMLHRVELARPKSVIGKHHHRGAPVRAALRLRRHRRRDGRAHPRRARRRRRAWSRPAASPPASPTRRRSIERVEPFLTLEGLRMIFEKNRALRAEPPAKGEVRHEGRRRSSDTHNFALVGHSGDGKTSLGEALLHAAGATPALGSVDDGTLAAQLPARGEGAAATRSRARRLRLRLPAASTSRSSTRPATRTSRPTARSRCTRSTAPCSCARRSDGAKVGTDAHVAQLPASSAFPLLAFVNGLDREHADFDAAVASLREDRG